MLKKINESFDRMKSEKVADKTVLESLFEIGEEECITESSKEELKPSTDGKEVLTEEQKNWTDVFENFLDLIEFDLIKTKDEDGKDAYALVDRQGANLGDIESERFKNAWEIFERLEAYILDYLVTPIEENLLEVGVECPWRFSDIIKLVRSEEFKNEHPDLWKGYNEDSSDIDMLDMIANHPEEIELDKALSPLYESLDETLLNKGKEILRDEIDWEQVDGSDIDNAIEQLRSLRIEEVITEDEYNFIISNWDRIIALIEDDNNREEPIDEALEKEIIYIKYWQDEEARDQGNSDVYADRFEHIEDAVDVAKRLIDRDGFASVEVLVSPSGEIESEDDYVVWGYDGVETWCESLKENVASDLVDEISYQYGISKAEAKRRFADTLKDKKASESKLNTLKGVRKTNAKAEIETESLKESNEDIHVFVQEEDDFVQDWYWKDEGLNGKDGGYGLLIIGNRDFAPKLYTGGYDDTSIKNAFNESESEEEFIEKLKEITGKDYKYIQFKGYSQGDWQDAYYPVGEFSKEYLSEIEDVYMGKYTSYYDETEEVGGYFVCDDSREPIKKQLSEQSGIPENKIKIRIIKGYKRVPEYADLDESLKESKNSNRLSHKKFVEYLDSIGNEYHAFSRVRNAEESGYRYTLSNKLTKEQEDYLKKFDNVRLGSAQYKYAPEITYSTVILIDRHNKPKELKEDTNKSTLIKDKLALPNNWVIAKYKNKYVLMSEKEFNEAEKDPDKWFKEWFIDLFPTKKALIQAFKREPYYKHIFKDIVVKESKSLKEDFETNIDWNGGVQEITRKDYYHFLDCMPPAEPKNPTDGYTGQFLMGEPYSSDEQGRLLFSKFGKKDGKYYFLGNDYAKRGSYLEGLKESLDKSRGQWNQAEIAREFGKYDELKSLENDLLKINGVKNIDFSLGGLYDNLGFVIIIDFDIELEDFYNKRRELAKQVREVALKHNIVGSDPMELDDNYIYWAVHNKDNKAFESLKEEIDYTDEKYLLKPYWYFTTHGVGVGSIPKSVKSIWGSFEADNGTYFATDSVISTKDLEEFEIKENQPKIEDIPEKVRINIQNWLEQPLNEARPRTRKEIVVLQGNYGYGWDDLIEYELTGDVDKDMEIYREIRQDYKDYAKNEPQYSHRTIHRFEKIEQPLKEDNNINGAFYGRQDIRDIKVEPGYHEWVLSVDDRPYYSFGDLSEHVDNFDEGIDFANWLLDIFIDEEEHNKNIDNSSFFTLDINSLSADETETLKNELIDAYRYYIGNTPRTLEYDRRAVERDYGLEDGELDGVSIEDAEILAGVESGELDRYLLENKR